MWEQKKVSTPQSYTPQTQLYASQQAFSGASALSQLPQQSQAHQQHQQQQQQQQQMMGAFGTSSLGPPPPYSPYAEMAHQQQPKYVPPMAYYHNQYVPSIPAMNTTYGMPTTASYVYPNSSQPHYQYNPYPNLPPNTTVVMPQAFDAGARFDHIARPVIPPPPPGVAPNAAQLAAMQGQSSILGQKKGSWLEGGSSGGYTFW